MSHNPDDSSSTISRQVRLWSLCLLFAFPAMAQKKGQVRPPSPVAAGRDGRLAYAADSLGNRIPDFSHCGYMSGGVQIPDVPVRVVVPYKKGDATQRIQGAIDYVASLPEDDHGFRGAVLLQKGNYEIAGALRI